MSLMRIAARIAAVQALKGRTLVGDNVLDSKIGAIEIDADGSLRTSEQKPFIAVYTDAADTKESNLSLRAMVINGATEILFETGITAAMTSIDPQTGESVLVGVGIPDTDAAFEFHLDLVVRQIGDALTDPDNAWGQVFAAIIGPILGVERSRTSTDEKGVRLAGHQIKLTARMNADPVAGEVLKPTSAMAQFLARADDSDEPDLAAQVAVIRSALAGTGLPDWKLDQQRYGRTGAEVDALLLRPAPGAENDVDVTEVAVGPPALAMP